jgi:uncharacterized membrane protein
MEKVRYNFVDEIRGVAIILMVIFHLFYDLNIFKFVSIDFAKDPFWWGLPRVIVFLFFISVGMGLPLAHTPKIKWNKFWVRFLKIAGFALLITLVTYFLFPDRWVYFGTLHCIAVCSLWALPFLKLPKVALLTFLALAIPSTFFDLDIPWIVLHGFSMDYISPFPWFGVVALGIFFFHVNFHKTDLDKWGIGPMLRPLRYMGKHSLLIYVIHQPVIFGTIFLLNKLIS